jgi:hypothetical protein
MTEPPAEARVDLLARRVRWLDSYRRGIAVGTAIALGPLIIHRLSSFLGVDWPQFHVMLLALVACVMSWWMIEAALAWMTALWETEYDRLVREKGLPRAVLRRRRRS